MNQIIKHLLTDTLFKKKQVKVYVQREDLVHPLVGGNKWRKLKYNLEAFRDSGKEWLLTFGGAYSNHILATAAAGNEQGIKTIGIIRGEELDEHSNFVLNQAAGFGMQLIFVSREQYRLRSDKSFIHELLKSNKLPAEAIYILPEGGANDLAVKGCSEIVKDVSVEFDYICCACGTGVTLAGIATALAPHQHAIGVAVLRAEKYLQDYVSNLTIKDNFSIVSDFTFGGYAKATEELISFCQQFTQRTQIEIEPIYTGKLFYGIYKLIEQDYFPGQSSIVIIHSGGLATSHYREVGTMDSDSVKAQSLSGGSERGLPKFR